MAEVELTEDDKMQLNEVYGGMTTKSMDTQKKIMKIMWWQMQNGKRLLNQGNCQKILW